MHGEPVPVTSEVSSGNLLVNCIRMKADSFVIGGVTVKFAGHCEAGMCPVIAICNETIGVTFQGNCDWQGATLTPSN